MTHGPQLELIELLSERMLADGSRTLWRRVFLTSLRDTVRFEARALTLLCVDAPRHGWSLAELDTFGQRFGGRCEPLGKERALFHFDAAAPALRAALLLQRMCGDFQFRLAVVTAPCHVARFEVDGQRCQVVLPPPSGSVQRAVDNAVPGTIHVCKESYPLLEDLLRAEVGDALVTVEFGEDAQAEASITLPPSTDSPITSFSTFAELR